VFDDEGHLMPNYGGPFLEVARRILQDAPWTARFYLANLAVSSKEQITREQFANS
jgi:hypothetical protein